MAQETLSLLLQELKFRTTPVEVPTAHHEAVQAFLEKETAARRTCRIHRLLAGSGIAKAQVRTFEDFDWHFNPTAPKEDILKLRNSPWIASAANLVMIGNPGLGKSHLAKAFCYEAILDGHSACFLTAFDLIAKIKRARYPENKINHYAKNIRVLCIDELGYVYHDKYDSDLIYHVISKRAETNPTIITSNLAPKDWGKVLSGAAASAVLDRLSHNGTFLTWEGKSYRLKSRRK